MIIREIQQNSEEWFEYRKGKSGGSEFGDLYIAGLPTMPAMKAKLDDLQIGYKSTAKAAELASLLTPETLAKLKLESDPKKRYYGIIAERVARPITPNDYIEQLNGEPYSAMARGHILEPEAIAAFCEKTGKKVLERSVVWERDDNPSIYISPDAIIVDEQPIDDLSSLIIAEAVEIKCLSNEETIKAYLTGSYPKEYAAQITKYFVVNDKLEKLYFVLYTDTIPGLEVQIFEITREQVADKTIEAKIFEDAVMRLIDRDTAKIAELGF